MRRLKWRLPRALLRPGAAQLFAMVGLLLVALAVPAAACNYKY